jgi:hypothetical protein
MIAGVIREVGTIQQKAEILPRALGGEIIIVLGFTEPGCGSDLAAVSTWAVRDGDQWVINGQKMFTTNAQVADYRLRRRPPPHPRRGGALVRLTDDLALMAPDGLRTDDPRHANVEYGIRWARPPRSTAAPARCSGPSSPSGPSGPRGPTDARARHPDAGQAGLHQERPRLRCVAVARSCAWTA